MNRPGTRPMSTRHARPWRLPQPLALAFALVLALGTLLPYTSDLAAAPQGGPDLPAATLQEGVSSLEVDVVRCPEDFDPNDLFGTCTGFGIDDVPVRLVHTAPAVGYDVTQQTDVPAAGGPGRTTFTDIPAGDYDLAIDLPVETGVRYYLYCGVAGGGSPLPAVPDDALDARITVPGDTAVACDLYVIPTGVPQSTIDLFAFTCEAGALPEGGPRDFAAFQAACTDVAPGVDFTLATGDLTVQETTDVDGEASFAYPAGEPAEFWADVALEEEEWLFCSVDRGEASEITMDDRGVATFDNAAAEALTCSWFLVEQPAATEEPGATEQPTAEPGELLPGDPTEEPTGVPQDQQSSIDLFAFTCPFDAFADPQLGDFEAFRTACGDVAPGIAFHLSTGEFADVQETDVDGEASFTYPAGEDVDFYAAVPLEADEFLFCSVDLGDAGKIEMDDQGVAHFANTAPEARTCSWFLIEDAPDPTAEPTDEPTQEPTQEPTAEPTDEPVTPAERGSITIAPAVCPIDYTTTPDTVSYEDLAADCDISARDVSFTFGYPNGDTDIRVSDGANPLVYTDLQPGTYTLYSSVPLEAAAERAFCTADGGNRYEREFSDRGVTTFADLGTEQIVCEWYIIPTNLRGEETGGSLEVHLSVCPAEYDGDAIYDDCHGNGLEGYEFTLEGEGGSFAGVTEILRSPGPGIVTFTSLPAGEYTLRGGPPGDFGAIRLYCSTQPDNTEADYAIEGATGTVTIGENEDVLCDWYFVPENLSGLTPTPEPTETPEPARAEILVTLYACPAADAGTWGGATLGQFEDACTDTVDDVTFRLGDPSAAPLSAKTGVSGDGAVRFYDLLPGDYTLAPALPSDLTSVAVFCTIDDGDPYQKALANGGTTFVNVEGEEIACSWFAVKDRAQPVQRPSGSITIREYLCEDDRADIEDWDKECVAGGSGVSFTLVATASGTSLQGTPSDQGIHVFSGLADGFYTLTQDEGAWCRAVADRVDNQSRVIVQGGGNTDVVIYQCGAVEGLPVTGSGPGGTVSGEQFGLTPMQWLAVGLALVALPLAGTGLLQRRKRPVTMPERIEAPAYAPETGPDGRTRMRFR